MVSSILLDYALFQLTPTRTRFDLVLCYGGKTEKLASGLLEPFISHLKFAKDQISKGGYSIKLCPPTNTASWFTKSTFERFVRFVSTPAVLERFVSLEREILQIEESSCQANRLSNKNVVEQLEEGSGSAANDNIRKSSDSSKLKVELEETDDAILEENSRVQLQRLLDTRKMLLRKEQAMAYARGLVAGFEVDNIDDLVSFADAFGASRLREACINFKDLCKKKRGDDLWMLELEAMKACLPPELSFLATSGIVLTNDFVPNGSIDASSSDSTATHVSSDSKTDDTFPVSDQTPSITPNVQVPMLWPNQMPQYMYNFQQLPPYQGYPFPTMQPIPSPYPRTMQWPPSMKDYSPVRKEKFLNRKGHEDSGDAGKSGSSDSDLGSDSDSHIQQDKKHSSTDTPYRKKLSKKSSKTVVIRNINYITPKKRNGEKVGVSDESSSEEDEFIDEHSLKQKIDDAVGSLEKLHKSNSGNHKKKGSHKNSVYDAPPKDSEIGLVPNASNGEKTNENWDAFQNLLMRDDEAIVNAQDEHYIIRNSGEASPLATNSVIYLEPEKVPRQRMAVADSFVVTQRDGRGDRVRQEDFEDADNFRPIMKRMGSTEEDLVIFRRLGESGSELGGVPSSCAIESSIIKPGKGEDWFVINHSGKPENQDSANQQTIFNGNCMLSLDGDCSNSMKSRKDVLVDDSFMLDAQTSAGDPYDSQWKTDIKMDADLTLSSHLENGTVRGNHEVVDFKEPNDLCVVLERDSGFESARESWTTDHRIDITFMEADRSSSLEAGDAADKKALSNCNTGTVKKIETNGRKVSGKGARSKTLPGSTVKSRTEVMSKSKKSPLVSGPTAQKSKLEKEEEMRKKMEDLVIQRQKRIAERTAAGGFTPAATKKVPSVSKTVRGSTNGAHSATRETNKISSVKVKAA